jgi:hypothetical protein
MMVRIRIAFRTSFFDVFPEAPTQQWLGISRLMSEKARRALLVYRLWSRAAGVKLGVDGDVVPNAG